MGFPILVRWHLYIESGPRAPHSWTFDRQVHQGPAVSLKKNSKEESVPISLRHHDSPFRRLFLSVRCLTCLFNMQEIYIMSLENASNLPSFTKVGEHNNSVNSTVPSHPPEVGHSVFSRGYKMNKRVVILNNALRWRHNERDSVSNHQPHDCLLNRLFRRRSKKTSKLRVTGLCVGKSPGTGVFPTQMASYAENVSVWWRHHVKRTSNCIPQIQYVFFFQLQLFAVE